MKEFIEIADSIKVEILERKNGNTLVDVDVLKPVLEILYRKGFEVSNLTIGSFHESGDCGFLSAVFEDHGLVFCFNHDLSKITDIMLDNFFSKDCKDFPLFKNEAIEFLLNKGLINKNFFFNLDFVNWD